MNALYENDALLAATDFSVHPGGAALTLRAVGLANLAPGARILDVGCGAGRTVRLLRESGYDAYGVDASEKLVRLADSPYVRLGDAHQIVGTYDALLLECVLSLLADKEAFFAAARAALNQGGKLILCELYPRGVSGSPVAAVTCANGLLAPDALAALLGKAGFTNVAHSDETDAFTSFLAMLVMEFGSVDAFLCEMAGGCQRAAPAGLKLGYAVSVWETK